MKGLQRMSPFLWLLVIASIFFSAVRDGQIEISSVLFVVGGGILVSIVLLGVLTVGVFVLNLIRDCRKQRNTRMKMNRKRKHWPMALLAFAVFALLSVLFLKVNPSPFELAKESLSNTWALIVILACIFGSFAIGVLEVVKEVIS